MGMLGLATKYWLAIFAVVLVGTGAVASGAVQVDGFTFSVGDNNGESDAKDLKEIDEATSKLKLGADGADTVYFFKQQPDGDYPVHWNDPKDFDAAEATKNLQEGIDFYKVSMDNGTATTSSTHPIMEPGNYHYAVVDQHGQIHDAFGTVEIEGEVQEYKLDNDYQQLITLPLDVKTTADSADVVTSTMVESGDATYSPATSLRASGESDFETVQTVTHTIEVQSGALYLGDIDLGTYTGANVSDAELVSATVDGQSKDALSGVDLSDHDLDNNVFGPSDDPEVAKDEVALEFRFEVESDIQDGDAVASGINVEDIYNAQTSSLSITG